jgi:TolB-like protein
MLLAWLGRAEDALQEARTVQELHRGAAPAWNLSEANIYAALGRADLALPLIEKMLSDHDGTGRWPITVTMLRQDPLWDKIRDEPGFQKLIAEPKPEAKPRLSAAPAAQPDAKSVAVLAFANLSDDKGNEYFSDGISEELLTMLQKIPGLHVAARTSAFSFKGKNATAQEIGEKLGVAHLVEGSVQKSGNRVKITARLSRAATGEELWSKSFPPRELTDAFAAESEIALAIVAELRGRLAGDATAQAVIEAQVQAAEIGGTKKVEARQLYLQGKFFSNQFNGENVRRAEELLQRAVELDPQFAQAWAALARTASIDAGYADTRGAVEAANALARRASDRALALAPGLAAAQLARFDVQAYDFDWRGAAESLRRATALAPGDAAVVASAANLAYYFGQIDQAIALSRRVWRLTR